MARKLFARTQAPGGMENQYWQEIDPATGGAAYPPSSGIPKADLDTEVQGLLDKAQSAIQQEVDPTVPAWAKTPNKPTYTAADVGAIPVSDKGVGIATLGANGLVPLEQLPPIGGGVPSGGTPGQILRKKTVADFDTAWSDEAGGGGYSPPVGGIPKGDLSQGVQDSLGRADTALQSFDETDPVYMADKPSIALKTDIPDISGKADRAEVEAVQADVDAIKPVIPNQASPVNQLADKNFVNSSIQNMAANFVTPTAGGDTQFASLAALNAGAWFHQGQAYTPTTNDYAIFINTDNSVWRASFDGVQWNAEFMINDSSFTVEQVSAINSGITAVLTGKLSGLPDNSALTALLAGKQSNIPASTAGFLATHSGTAGTFGTPKDPANFMSQGTNIPNNADLDTYTTAGFYNTTSDVNAQTILNLPPMATTINGFSLQVSNVSTTARVQTLIMGSNPVGRAFVRFMNSAGTWLAWTEILSSNGIRFSNTYTIPANSIGYLGTITTRSLVDMNIGVIQGSGVWSRAIRVRTSYGLIASADIDNNYDSTLQIERLVFQKNPTTETSWDLFWDNSTTASVATIAIQANIQSAGVGFSKLNPAPAITDQTTLLSQAVVKVGLNSYSTTEQKTNRYWTDGKLIYRKVVSGNFAAIAASTRDIIQIATGISELVSCMGSWQHGGVGSMQFGGTYINVGGTTIEQASAAYLAGGNVSLMTYSIQARTTSHTYKIVLEYTKA